MAATEDPRDAAERAGLTYASDEEPGIRRIRCGRGFRYVGPDGSAVVGAERERLAALVIPPAWTEVWICPDPLGHIQATGRDAAGRKVYRYHDVWREARDLEKFDSLLAFGSGLGELRRQVARDLARRGLPRERVLALAVRLLDETLIRVGNPEYAARESFGLTTLEARHVEAGGGRVIFEFTGKHQVEHRIELADPQLCRLVGACDEAGGDLLFSYLDGTDVTEITSDDVNDYLRELAGPRVTARDFRTWGGTVTVVQELGTASGRTTELGPSAFLAAVDVAAERLGNTRDVCRRAYVHPQVEPALGDGRLTAAWRRSRRTTRLTRAERATLRLLADA